MRAPVSENGQMILVYKGHRFAPEIISEAVWLYHRFTLSLRGVEDLLAERDIIVSYEAIRFLSVHGRVQNLFRVGRGHLKAVYHRLAAPLPPSLPPMGYQTNLMVYGPGGYRCLDFTRVGARLNFVDRGDDLDPPDLGKSDRWRLGASLVSFVG